MKKTVLILSTLSVLLSTGCASIVGGGAVKQSKIDSLPTDADVKIEKIVFEKVTDPETGFVKLKNKTYVNVAQGKTPIMASLDRCSDYRFTLNKDGKIKEEVIEPRFNTMMLGNLVFGGVIGLMVDAGTCARLVHEDEYVIDLNSNKTYKDLRQEKLEKMSPSARRD